MVVVPKPLERCQIQPRHHPGEKLRGLYQDHVHRPHDIFVNTDLKVGMRLKTVMGQYCAMSLQEASICLRLQGRVVITASVPAAASPTVALTVTEVTRHQETNGHKKSTPK
mmetsp:Transcript_22092/g.53508  ORF Transcript_22092/g.53508 Transcript_22092/m.53508 type:complete len:111 (+) Transcript_22092:2256-2588(+)